MGESEFTADYDDVRQYELDAQREQDLLEYQTECTFIWSNKVRRYPASSYRRRYGLMVKLLDLEG